MDYRPSQTTPTTGLNWALAVACVASPGAAGSPVGGWRRPVRQRGFSLVVALLLALALPGAVIAQQGSNLGSYATQYRPPAITGAVTTTGGSPVSGARIETPDGHFTATAADGTFTLFVDVPGLYNVKVSGNGVVLAPVQVSVTTAGATQDFVLDIGPAVLPGVAVPLRFDFGTSGSPVAAGYRRVSETTTYGGASGYGWNAGSRASRDRGTSTALTRDFNFCTSCTFLVTVPDGDYLLRVSAGDASGAHDQMSFTAEGVLLDTLTAAKNQFLVRSYQVTIADQQLTLEIADAGGSDANAVINALELIPLWPRQFDLGTATSPVAPNSFRVTDATAYDATLGYGWLSGTRKARDRGAGSASERDFVFTTLGAFAVDVPEGAYVITLLLGDATSAHDQMGIFLEGAKVDSVTTGAGELTLRDYRIWVGDGQLTIGLDDLGGGDANVVLNAIRLAPADPLKLDFGTASSPVAAGWSRVRSGLAYDKVRGYGWSAGTVYERDRGGANPLTRDLNFSTDATFSADVGNGVWDVVLIVGDSAAAHDDVAVELEGVQRDVLSSGKNEFVERTYRVMVTDDDLQVRLDDTGGSDANAVISSLCIVPACTFRFDFGTAASPLEPGYTRVTDSTTYQGSVGYGWAGGVVGSRDRGNETALRRDLNFTALATFAVDAANGLYDVVVTLGDRSAGHDEMGVYVEGELAGSPSTGAGQFAVVTARAWVADGQLSVTFDDLGGSDANVVVNALTVRCADRYDFGTSSSPLAVNHIRVAGDAFTAASGWGWTAGSVGTRDRAVGDDIVRDLNFTTSGTFEAALPDGTYAVTITFADAAAGHDEMGVSLEGTLTDTVTLSVGAVTTRTYFVSVSDGALTVSLDDLGGKDANTVISGLVIERL